MLNAHLPPDQHVKFEEIWDMVKPEGQREIEKFLREHGLDRLIDQLTPDQIHDAGKTIDWLRERFGFLLH